MVALIKAAQLLLSLSILIFLHELGHYLAARRFNTRVEKFYLFMNPGFSLFKKQIGETEWGLGWKPKIVPEDGMATYARLLREHFAHSPSAGPPAGPSAESSAEGGTGESAATSEEPVS